MVQNTTKLGGTASDVVVGRVAHGLMMMTWRDPNDPLPEEEAFEAIKAGVDSLPLGVKMLINSGEFYGPNFSTANLEMLARFFEKHPEYADKTFLSVKGGMKFPEGGADSSPEGLRRSVDNINAVLRGTKKLDLFQSARVDSNIPIEDAIETLKELIKEGKFDHIGMSECKAETLRRAYAVHPIAVVEIEVSPWSYEEETKKVITTAGELGTVIAAYSPLGRGFLTGSIKSIDDLSQGDMRRVMTRFREEYFKQNLANAEAFRAYAEKRKVTPAQLAIAWVASLGDHVIPLGVFKHRTLENLAGGDITFTDEDKAEVAKIMAEYEIKGDRYFGNDAAAHLWG